MARVLVVERSPKIGGLVAGQLRENGFDATDVRHGAEAALELRRQPCDLILLDNQVPMGGVKTARILRLHPKIGSIPIILGLPINKDEARQVIRESHKIGMKNFLRKPFTLAALRKKLGEVLGDPKPVEQPTVMEIREELRNLSNLPAMPEAHSKLLSLLSKADAEVDLNQVAKTLELDAAMSAKVMRTCRSAFFGFQGSMMKQAVAYLGVAVIRQIVQSAVVVNIFKDEKEGDSSLSMRDLWRHSMATGLAMEVIGKADKKKTHFLLGVLHDVGKAVFKFRFSEHFKSVLDLVGKEGISMYKAEQELLGITHAECGGELAVHWDLPGEVRTAITAHHTPGETTQHKRLAAMVHIADIAVRTMKIGFAGDDLIPKMDPYASRLQKSVDEITGQQEEIVKQIDAMMGPADGEEEN